MSPGYDVVDCRVIYLGGANYLGDQNRMKEEMSVAGTRSKVKIEGGA